MAYPQSANDAFLDYQSLKSQRQPLENDFRLASAYCLPTHYGSWLAGDAQVDPSITGMAQATLRRTTFDTTGTRSLPKFMAILERLLTPSGMKYLKLQASQPSLMKAWRVRDYFDQITDMSFKLRNSPHANFRRSSNEVYGSIGAYGTGPILINKRKPNAISREPGIIYKSRPLRDIFLKVNNNGEVDTVMERYWYNVRQYVQEHGINNMPRGVRAEYDKGAQANQSKYFEFVHCVQPRSDYDPEAWDARAHPFCGWHLAVEDKQYVGEEEGWKRLPYLTPRDMTVSGDPYGKGPASKVLAGMGGASAMKKSHLKQGNIAAEPVILAYDDGVLNGNVDLRPGHVNYGGLDRQGRKLIDTLQGGSFDIGKDLLIEEQNDIEDGFLVSIFQTLNDRPEMTATEVLEIVADKAALLSPTMGGLQSELGGPMVEIELDVMAEIGWLNDLPMPPELAEARGQYDVQYTSPLAKGMYAEEVSGFFRAVEFSVEIAQATQDPSHLDHYDFDTAIPEIADKTNVPTRWMASAEKIKQIRDGRAQQQQTQQLLDAAPGLASAAKTAVDASNGLGTTTGA
jgi:head-to-tail connecting protein